MRVNSIQHTFMEHLSGVRYMSIRPLAFGDGPHCLWSVFLKIHPLLTLKKGKMTVFPQEHQRDIFT